MPSQIRINTTQNQPPLATPPGPTSPQHEKEAQRAIRHTDSWTPALGRRQSYHKEDQKHALQMRAVRDVKEGPGFSELHV